METLEVTNSAADAQWMPVMKDRMSFGKFLARTAVAVVLLGIVLAFIAAFLVPTPKITTTVPATRAPGISAGIESTVNYKWTKILGPDGVALYTQCSSIEQHIRIYVSSGGDMDFRPDLGCK